MNEQVIASPQLPVQTRNCFLRYRLGAVAIFLAALLAAALGTGFRVAQGTDAVQLVVD